MADDSSRAVKMARILAVLHIIVGVLLFCISIAVLVNEKSLLALSLSPGVFSFFVGVVMCIAGGIGIPGTRKEGSESRKGYAGTFMGLSITSAVFGVGVVIVSSLSIVSEEMGRYEAEVGRSPFDRAAYDRAIALSATTLVLGIVELVIGIAAALCLCHIPNPPYSCGGEYLCTYLPYAL